MSRTRRQQQGEAGEAYARGPPHSHVQQQQQQHQPSLQYYAQQQQQAHGSSTGGGGRDQTPHRGAPREGLVVQFGALPSASQGHVQVMAQEQLMQLQLQQQQHAQYNGGDDDSGAFGSPSIAEGGRLMEGVGMVVHRTPPSQSPGASAAPPVPSSSSLSGSNSTELGADASCGRGEPRVRPTR